MQHDRRQHVSIVLLLVILLHLPALSQHQHPDTTEIRGHTMYTLLEPGDIPAIFEPEFISVTQAGDSYYPNEPVIAVIRGDESKAYSTWHLDQHEVVNDYIGGEAITVTW